MDLIKDHFIWKLRRVIKQCDKIKQNSNHSEKEIK